jgi:molybdopterin converting factor small subunit
MATATLVLPTVLRPIAGKTRFTVAGPDVGAALEDAFARVPVLRRHLLLPDGDLRPHVLCLVNGICLARATWRGTGLADGDEILIHQAISGG